MYFCIKFKVKFYDFCDPIALKIADLVRENHSSECNSKSENNYITFTKKKKTI